MDIWESGEKHRQKKMPSRGESKFAKALIVRGAIIMTNGDKIRSMSDMELSRELCKIAGVCSECLVQDMCDKGHTGFEQWLKEEVNEDE